MEQQYLWCTGVLCLVYISHVIESKEPTKFLYTSFKCSFSKWLISFVHYLENNCPLPEKYAYEFRVQSSQYQIDEIIDIEAMSNIFKIRFSQTPFEENELYFLESEMKRVISCICCGLVPLSCNHPELYFLQVLTKINSWIYFAPNHYFSFPQKKGNTTIFYCIDVKSKVIFYKEGSLPLKWYTVSNSHLDHFKNILTNESEQGVGSLRSLCFGSIHENRMNISEMLKVVPLELNLLSLLKISTFMNEIQTVS